MSTDASAGRRPPQLSPTTGPDEEAWVTAVENYLDQLGRSVERLDTLLSELRLSVMQTPDEKLASSLVAVTETVQRMESLLAGREELLTAANAPAVGSTLREKLIAVANVRAARTAAEAEQLSGRVSTVHGKAMSLFVCGFHLTQWASHMVRVHTQTVNQPTYDRDGRSDQDPRSGGIFEDAA